MISQIDKTKTEKLTCPVCGKQFVKTEDHKYIVREGYTCSWKCFLERVKGFDEKNGKRLSKD